MRAQCKDSPLKKYAEHVLFKADFVVFWPRKEVVEPTKWVQNPLDKEQSCLCITSVGSNAKTCQAPNLSKKGLVFGLFDRFKTWDHHLQPLFPATTVEFLAQTSCDYTSHP